MATGRCPKCRGVHPFCLPPYQRVEKKDGVWRPMEYGICRCDEGAYQFLVVGLAEKKNREARAKAMAQKRGKN